MPWIVRVHPGAQTELRTLPRNEQAALDNAMKKLEALGPLLGYPHDSHIQGAEKVRELRPRAGRSAWRAFYSRVKDVYVVAAIGPEAHADRRGFRRAVAAAAQRVSKLTQDDD